MITSGRAHIQALATALPLLDTHLTASAKEENLNGGRRLVVVGDVLLDRDIIGTADRLSHWRTDRQRLQRWVRRPRRLKPPSLPQHGQQSAGQPTHDARLRMRPWHRCHVQYPSRSAHPCPRHCRIGHCATKSTSDQPAGLWAVSLCDGWWPDGRWRGWHTSQMSDTGASRTDGIAPGSGGPPGLDLVRLARYLDRASPGLLAGAGIGAPLTAEIIAGGKSNLTYRVSGGADAGPATGAVVLRRPPLGHVLPTAHDMAREYRIIAALCPTGFPVPVPLHLCPDPDPIGAPFYLMSYVDGWVLRGPDDVASLSSGAAAHTGELLVDTLAALHAIDPAAIGLADFGRPDGYLERQVRRWYEQWERSKTGELAALDEVADRLRAGLPVSSARGAPARSGIVHGDYRLDNVVMDAEVSRILAVLDWEMATLGDPLADVGLLVAYTDLAAAGLAPTQPRMAPSQGFLSATQLVDRYARATGADLDRIAWYSALGYYKLAIISEGIHARYRQGKTVGAGFAEIGRLVPVLVDRALTALTGPPR